MSIVEIVSDVARAGLKPAPVEEWHPRPIEFLGLSEKPQVIPFNMDYFKSNQDFMPPSWFNQAERRK